MKIKLKKLKKIQKLVNKKTDKVMDLIEDFVDELLEITPKDSTISLKMGDVNMDKKTGIVHTEITFDIPLAKIKI